VTGESVRRLRLGTTTGMAVVVGAIPGGGFAVGAQLRRKIEGCLYSAVAIFESAANDELLTECREQFMPDHCNPHTMTQEALAAA
jgi:hypothetical protein